MRGRSTRLVDVPSRATERRRIQGVRIPRAGGGVAQSVAGSTGSAGDGLFNGETIDIDPGEVVLLENCRFNVGEANDDSALAERYAMLCEVFVMDAFGAAHRAQASTHGVIHRAHIACGGPLLMAELDALGKALDIRAAIARDRGRIEGFDQTRLLRNLLGARRPVDRRRWHRQHVHRRAGHRIGKSLYEADLVGVATQIIEAQKRAARRFRYPSMLWLQRNSRPTRRPRQECRRRRQPGHDPGYRSANSAALC